MFLSLPLEIRIQIYSNVLESNPARHAHLSPSPTYPEASSSALFLKAITVPVTEQFSDGIDVGKTDPQPFPSVSSLILGSCFSPSLRGTGCGCIPTALLMTCKQVYEEARTLPWERNEYAFINWFCSGVYAARSFMRALKPWQRESMRFARLEVLRRDLEGTWVSTMVGGRPETGEWKDLCRLWSGDVETGKSGLWGLKLGIKGSVGTYVVGEAIDGSGGVSVALAEPKTEKYNVDKRQNGQKGLLDINAQWITDGLTHMTSLRWLEIEIEDDDVSRDAKVDFCLNLGNKLSYISGIRVEILFVEKLVEEAKDTTQDERVWGQPGDDYIWGLDM
jgi:hypothetical protein